MFRAAKRAPAPLGSWQTRGEVRVGFGIACSVQAGRLGTLWAIDKLCWATLPHAAAALVQFACSLSYVYYVD